MLWPQTCANTPSSVLSPIRQLSVVPHCSGLPLSSLHGTLSNHHWPPKPFEIFSKPSTETEQPHIPWALLCSYMTLWLTSLSSCQSPPIMESSLLIKQVMPSTPKLWQADKVGLIWEASVTCLSNEPTGRPQYTVETHSRGDSHTTQDDLDRQDLVTLPHGCTV